MRKSKRYTIDGQEYVLNPLVLGQLWQLGEVFEGLRIPCGGIMPLLSTLGPYLPHCLAIILTPVGQSPGEKDLDQLAGFFEEVEAAQAAVVLTDLLQMHPDLFSTVEEKEKKDAGASKDDGRDVFEELLALLCCNDFTRREPILWGMTIDQAKVWTEKCGRELLFREAILAYLGAGQENTARPKKTGQDLGEYCGGKSVDECRKQFGSALEAVCATCPD